MLPLHAQLLGHALPGAALPALPAWLSGRGVLLGVAFSVLTFVGSIAVTVWVLTRLPPDYFSRAHGPAFWPGQPRPLRWLGLVGKNLLGGLLLLLGVVMSLPGVPGQGILTILLGLMLLDIPGKRRVESKIVSSQKVWRTINRIRARYHKPPLTRA